MPFVWRPHSEFTCAVQVSFDVDLKVNVFEANIRLLGGLLSAHLLASDPSLGLMLKPYHGELLTLATDLGDRLMDAFEASPTGTVSSSAVCNHHCSRSETTFAMYLYLGLQTSAVPATRL